MKKVLVLGAGMVSHPLVHYLLDHNFAVTLGDIRLEQAVKVIDGRPHGQAVLLDGSNLDSLKPLIAEHDLVISLLPPPLHPSVARLCLDGKRHFLTASYQSQAMMEMAEEVKENDLIFINEVGLDPGLDHMTAMEIIDTLKREGYTIDGFDSHCGGLPAKAAANNPLRYKFSWSPRGVLGALTRDSRFRIAGELKEVPGDQMLAHHDVICVPEVGVFESTPNADALYYGDQYGLSETPTVRRGTLRYPGWARFWQYMLAKGFMDQNHKVEAENDQVSAVFFRAVGMSEDTDWNAFLKNDCPEHASRFLEIVYSLGLLDPEFKITGSFSAFDVIFECAGKTMNYAPGEADLVVLHHEFFAHKGDRKEKWTSTIVREGEPNGTTAMAFLVGLPAAIAARLVLEDRIERRGVLIPITPDLYGPILKEMEQLGLAHDVQKTVIV